MQLTTSGQKSTANGTQATINGAKSATNGTKSVANENQSNTNGPKSGNNERIVNESREMATLASFAGQNTTSAIRRMPGGQVVPHHKEKVTS